MNKPKIKILYVTDCLGNGGKERQLVEILENINKERFSCGVITFKQNDYYSDKIKSITDYYYVYDKNNIFMPLFTVWKSFEEYRPHIVHTLDSLSSSYVLIPARYYKVLFINGSIQDTGIESGFIRAKKNFLLKCSDLVISNSYEGLSAYGVEGEVLYNIINTDRFRDVKDKTSFDIIMVANFSEYKDYDYFLKICRKLIANNLIDNAYVAGSGKYLKKYRNYVNENNEYFIGKVKFLGDVRNIEEILSCISVGFLCSTRKYGEGISNSVLEYMAAGVVPVVTNIGASKEIINDGINGFLIEDNQENKVVDIISRLKTDKNLYDLIIRNAKNTLENKFNVKNNMEYLESIYENYLN